MFRKLTTAALIVVSLASGAVAFAGEQNLALGCGMPEMPISGTAKDRLNLAQKDLERGNYYQAHRVAKSVAAMKEADGAQQAAAHAIAGWVLWHNGAKESALKELREAKRLDASSLGVVLAKATDAKVNAEVKKALEV